MKVLIREDLIAQVCDESSVEMSNEVKRTVSNNLVSASSISKITSHQEEIIAFYLDGRIIKISATDNMSQNEEIFFDDNGRIRYYEISCYRKGNQFRNAGYFNESEKLVCYEEGMAGNYKKFSKKTEERILRKVSRYLEEVQ
ncbi:MAG: hypothetical protein N2510_06090 [Ignavibacteria bacterium]|nr:hypothetical protein [Ignavibacteria bacterium]